ncbi:FtsK/SpoIIIE domain-containing protein [Arthrobacter ruber]|uniref:FtsK/SpoIIIE domain-containing protein n=1 Tax=Arthrobacter ruber TaxID=1258893 RepID=UPI000CF51799|nr:FtsK/SpoIIIE domain-containing protein [Arthrobacter ruber]
MDLHVTLASAPPSGFASREIVVDTTRLPTGAALAERLEAAGYQGPFSIDDTPLETATAHAGALTDGAIIVCGPRPAPADPSRLPHLLFVVHSGPDAGQVIPLTRGAYILGRSAGGIAIADPGLSRRHALLTVTGDAIILEDLGSANGTFVDGERIDATEITVSADLRFGTSRCRIELLDDDGWRHVSPAEVLEALPVGPDPPKRPSRLLILTALLPLVLGVALVLTTGMWFLLAFSALSAATGVVPLLTYRKEARVFGEAVRGAAGRDRERRMASVPDPGQTALDVLRARRDATAGPTVGAPSSPVILLRLGTADQAANLRIGRDDGSLALPILPDLPLVLPWLPDTATSSVAGTSGRTFTITGETAPVLGLLRAMLLQVAHPGQVSIPVVCWGSVRHLPIHARFLPNVRLTQDPLVLALILEQTDALLLLHVSGELPEVARRRTVLIVRFLMEQAGSAGTAVPDDGMTITADGALARVKGREYRVVPDGVSASSFERTARLLGRVAGARPAPQAIRPGAGGRPGGALPPSVSLWSEHFRPDTLATSIPGRWASADAGRPTVFIGLSTTGAVSIDLVRDGPHLLVAGTTGSGKSEFLRTLVLGLALDQPPWHLTALLVDYKGGSGLGALASLPHCVGCLTDLSPESTARALTSLRAELRRREQLCADHGARDLDELRTASPSSCPPRLVVVIDEFRILGDDVPSAVPDLMKIAALGRSLGIHLILATQRAQGAVTPDLRANITSSVLLRVQTPMDSHDILGSGVAADIPVDARGRAFLRRGTEPPVGLQVAAASHLPTTDGSPGWQDVADYLGEDTGNRHRHTAEGDPAGSERDLLERAVAGLVAAHEVAGGSRSGAAGRADGRQPSRPVLPPLPTQISAAGCAAFEPADADVEDRPVPSSETRVPFGVADFPERQAQRLLCWRPSAHSHLALVGLPGSGAAEALAAVASSLPACDPDIHLYVLDGDGTLGRWSALPQVGAYVPSHETKRACRVLERLAAVPDTAQGGAASIVLVLTGWGRWSSRFRDGRLARAEDALHAIVRDGVHSGVAVLIAGDRELTASRFFALLPNRVYLPLGAHQETTLTWPKLPQINAVPGRGFAQGRITGAWGDGTCQLLAATGSGTPPARPPARSPFPVHPLPHEVQLRDIVPADTSPALDDLLLGVHDDDLRPFTVTVRPGEVYLVLGHPGSGRTNALRVLRASAEHVNPGRTILAPPAGEAGSAASAYWRGLGERSAGRGSADDCLLLVDDADRLSADVHQVLSGLVARGAAAALSAVPGPALTVRVPLALQARAAGRGLVLAPRTAGDGDVFGVRLDLDGSPIAGRGYACEPGVVLEVQVARASGDRP